MPAASPDAEVEGRPLLTVVGSTGCTVCSQPVGELVPGWNWAWTGTCGGLHPLGLREAHLGEADAVGQQLSMMVGQGPAVLETLDASRTDRAVELDRGVQPTPAPAPGQQGQFHSL